MYFNQFDSIYFETLLIYGHRPKIHTLQYINIWMTWRLVQSITLQVKYKTYYLQLQPCSLFQTFIIWYCYSRNIHISS